MASPDRGFCYRARQGWEFFLHHDVPVWQNYQDNWRHCDKCWALFYHGHPTNCGCRPAAIAVRRASSGAQRIITELRMTDIEALPLNP